MATIEIPSLLRQFTEKQIKLIIDSATLSDLLEKLVANYPSLKTYLIDSDNKICSFINIYVNGQDVRFLENEKTPLKDNDVITIIPAIAGG